MLPWCLHCGGATSNAEAMDADSEHGDGSDANACPDLVSCESACRKDDAAGCEYAGRMYETGEGAAQDYDKAAELYDKACLGGREEACAHLAMMYDIGLAVEEDPKRAHDLYEKACQQGNRWACKRGEQLDH
jgi:TPR repeat protein